MTPVRDWTTVPTGDGLQNPKMPTPAFCPPCTFLGRSHPGGNDRGTCTLLPRRRLSASRSASLEAACVAKSTMSSQPGVGAAGSSLEQVQPPTTEGGAAPARAAPLAATLVPLEALHELYASDYDALLWAGHTLGRAVEHAPLLRLHQHPGVRLDGAPEPPHVRLLTAAARDERSAKERNFVRLTSKKLRTLGDERVLVPARGAFCGTTRAAVAVAVGRADG